MPSLKLLIIQTYQRGDRKHQSIYHPPPQRANAKTKKIPLAEGRNQRENGSEEPQQLGMCGVWGLWRDHDWCLFHQSIFHTLSKTDIRFLGNAFLKIIAHMISTNIVSFYVLLLLYSTKTALPKQGGL